MEAGSDTITVQLWNNCSEMINNDCKFKSFVLIIDSN